MRALPSFVALIALLAVSGVASADQYKQVPRGPSRWSASVGKSDRQGPGTAGVTAKLPRPRPTRPGKISLPVPRTDGDVARPLKARLGGGVLVGAGN